MFALATLWFRVVRHFRKWALEKKSFVHQQVWFCNSTVGDTIHEVTIPFIGRDGVTCGHFVGPFHVATSSSRMLVQTLVRHSDFRVTFRRRSHWRHVWQVRTWFCLHRKTSSSKWWLRVYNTMQCNAMQCNAMQCNAMQYNTIQKTNIEDILTMQYNTMGPRGAYFNITHLLCSVSSPKVWYCNFKKSCYWTHLGFLRHQRPRQKNHRLQKC